MMQISGGSAADNDLKTMLTADLPKGSEALVGLAKSVAKALHSGGGERDVGRTQIRAIFDELRQIEALWLRDPGRAIHRLHLLGPKLAYRRARAREIQPLEEKLSSAIQLVLEAPDDEMKRARFDRLVEFCEAVIAYHVAESSDQTRGRR